MKKFPDQPHLIPERSDPLAGHMVHAHATVFDLLRENISPIAMHCNEEWKKIFERICLKYGYVWEWVPDKVWEDIIPQDWQVRTGEAVLTKVS